MPSGIKDLLKNRLSSRQKLAVKRAFVGTVAFGARTGAGIYRLIDFPLSNCVHSGVEDVWVLQQYRLQSLNDELANGRPWDLDRTYGACVCSRRSSGPRRRTGSMRATPTPSGATAS